MWGQITEILRTPLYRNAYALMLNSVSVSGLGLLYWILATHFYSDKNVGLNSAAISVMMFLSQLSLLNMGSALNRFIPQAGQKTRRFVLSVYGISLSLALLAAIGFVVFSNVFLKEGNFLNGNLPLTLWFIGAVMLWGIFTLQDAVMIGLRQAIWLPIENSAFGIAKILLLIALAGSLPSFGVFAAYTVPMFILVFPVNLLIFRYLIPRHMQQTTAAGSEITVRHLSRFISADYIGALFSMFSTSTLPLLVTNQLGSQQNAYFYIAWTIGEALDLFSINMAISLTVEGANDPAKLLEYSRKSLIHMLQILTPAVIGVLIFAPLVLSIFGQDYASNGATLLRLLGIAILPKAVNNLFLGISRVQRQMGKVIVVQASLAILVLSLSYLFSLNFGITGIGIAWLVSATTVALVLIITQFLPLLRRNQR
jgi:O-antigen/teichoic acid export membrane protein